MSADDSREDFLRPRLSPGTRLNGIYEIDHPIGLGGMGEIYKGHLVETGDPVAIKMMLPEMSDQAAFTLFRKEASALHHIQHDAVVRYYRLYGRAGASTALPGDGICRGKNTDRYTS